MKWQESSAFILLIHLKSSIIHWSTDVSWAREVILGWEILKPYQCPWTSHLPPAKGFQWHSLQTGVIANWLLGASNCACCLTVIMSHMIQFHPYPSSVKVVLLFSLYRWGNQVSRRFNSWLKNTQLVSDRDRLWLLSCLLPNQCLLSPSLHNQGKGHLFPRNFSECSVSPARVLCPCLNHAFWPDSSQVWVARVCSAGQAPEGAVETMDYSPPWSFLSPLHWPADSDWVGLGWLQYS